MVLEDVMGPKKLLSKTGGTAPAGAAAAAPAPAVTVEPVATDATKTAAMV